MNNLTYNTPYSLSEILETQDLGSKTREKILNGLLSDGQMEYKNPADPITSYIVTAFMSNLYGKGDADNFVTDMDYAIDQLKRARNLVAKAV